MSPAPRTRGTLYKALGIDPTKTRPSNEAAAARGPERRVAVRRQHLVDALNLVSLKVQLPFGLYDAAKLEPPITLRKAAPG
jgi:DNA/RNA-binding domain of Phe-tRNA-synthetase-like protein